jgi:preprotein translocase subunit SecF
MNLHFSGLKGIYIMSQEKDNSSEKKKRFRDSAIMKFYEKNYIPLMIIPILLLVFAIVQISYQVATTGDFIIRDITLKGGVTVTVLTEKEANIKDIDSSIKSDFPKNDIAVRKLSRTGTSIGYIIDADIQFDDMVLTKSFLDSIGRAVGVEMQEDIYTVESVGSALGSSFFRETFVALIFAFILMGIVVAFYFRSFIPTLAVVLCAFSDMIVTLAIVNMMGMRIGTAGIAAFLMLIGYSVDTDILLSTKALKRKRIGTPFERMLDATGTGLMMTITTILALAVGIIFTQSEVIKQIMTILFIGLCVDMIDTWIQNVGIIRFYLERKENKVKSEDD